MKIKTFIPFALFITLLFVFFTDTYSETKNGKISIPAYYGDYDKDWKTVDSLVNYGLPKSALEFVEKIYEKAKNENNAPNFVKSIIYKIKLQANTREEAFEKSIDELTTEVQKSDFPVKPVLQSLLADMYWTYYQTNRYKILSRSKTINFEQNDIKTWDLSKFVTMVKFYYNESLQDAVRLQSTKIEIYDEILNDYYNNKNAPNGRMFRPTLYDFLVHKAIDFYMGKEPELTRPAEQFTLNDQAFFGNAEDFVKFNISTYDSSSFKYYAISLLQQTIKFHLTDVSPDALVMVDLKRLNYVNNNSANDDKVNLYLKALDEMSQKYSSSSIYSTINYYKANYIYERSKKYNPDQSEEYKWDTKTAIEICDNAIFKYPESDGAINCTYLKSLITTKSVGLQTEDVNIPNTPFKCLVSYNNVSTLYFRVCKADRSDAKSIYTKDENYYTDKINENLIKYYSSETPVSTFTINLPDDKDYQKHSVEVKIPSLQNGEYIILAGTSSDLNFKENAVAFCFTTVSNISFISRSMPKGNMDFYVLNRQTGLPMHNVEATMYYEKYNPDNYKYDYIKGNTYKSDIEGYFNVPAYKDYRRYYLEFKSDNDFLNSALNGNDYFASYYGYMSGLFYQSAKYETNIEDSYNYVYFFTDRSIYRPGQTIYFKGIVINTKGKENKIVPNFSCNVTFKDVNYKEISFQKLTSNEYGTFSGTFTAPTGVLNGQMSIVAETYGNIYIQVEDYKRPKFEVKFDEIKGSYRLGDVVTMKGNALAYSGANIDNAQVKYRIVRKAVFPYWWFYWYGYYPTSPEVEILNGSTTTNEKGEYEIKFNAIPDKSVPKESKPYFTYTVTVDVTDINGETRSGTKYVSVGYNSLKLGLDIKETIDKNEKNDFKIKTTNLNDQFEPAAGTITIYKLKSPDRAFRNSNWQKPDKYLYSKDEYKSYFPDDAYGDENNIHKWEKEIKAKETDFNTGIDTILRLDEMKNWNQGVYLVEMKSKDKFGEEVKEQFYFTAYSTGETSLPYPSYDWFYSTKDKGEPNETASFLSGCSKSAKILYEIEQDGNVIEKSWISFNNNQSLTYIPIKEDYRGNIFIHYNYVLNNRAYSHQQVIEVPYTNKMLDITFETFRDKLQAGENEEWRVKIAGKYGDKVAAELVATLYDASLDAFKAHNWNMNLYYPYYSKYSWASFNCFGVSNGTTYFKDWNKYEYYKSYYYDYLNLFGMPFAYQSYYYNEGLVSQTIMLDGAFENAPVQPTLTNRGGRFKDDGDLEKVKVSEEKEVSKDEDKKDVKKGKTKGDDKRSGDETPKEITGVTARKNFNETAFFYPHLETDANGEILIKFQVPEALTKWKMLGFANTKDLKIGFVQNELVTQKELMIVPNAPRFFRESDNITFTTKITNLADKDLNGDVQLELFDATTMKPIDDLLSNKQKVKTFEVKKGESTSASWELYIPFGTEAVMYRIVAKADKFSDGEENVLPVLSNRMLVTETMLMPLRSNQTKTFVLDKLANNKSNTLTNFKLTLEFTSNPAWYAIQALPYLMEYPWECAEMTFSRIYANSIASHIANSDPKIKKVFDTWSNYEPNALLSNLEKNEELKTVFLEETPWVREAKDETERKRRVGVLFEIKRMTNELDRAINKLKEMQYSNGGWPWFAGMPEDRYMTQYFVTGFGHLDRLKVRNIRDDYRIWDMVTKAIGYMDYMIIKDYEYLKELASEGKIKMDDNNLWQISIDYLYARSYFTDIPIPENTKEAFNYYKGQEVKYWNDYGTYLEGMMALTLNRFGNPNVPLMITKSLREKAVHNDELGMYWIDNTWGYYWYQAPIETQSLLIEVFDEVAKDNDAVDEMKVWLLKQKQTQDWKTTKATAEACYALLLKGTDWLATDPNVDIQLGDIKINPANIPDLKYEAGTGYFKTNWWYDEVKPEMGNVTASKKGEGVSWGAVYWQYFEQLDKITRAETPLKLDKKLFLQQNSSTGLVITPIDDKTTLKIGDLVKVRIELRVDRDMEYVHMKDMRAACFEPINVISQYKYQGGLGYYESTRDAATHFFFGWLAKGTYIFEYSLRVTNTGDFSNGITNIECMYAPEFTSHSEGVRVKVVQ